MSSSRPRVIHLHPSQCPPPLSFPQQGKETLHQLIGAVLHDDSSITNREIRQKQWNKIQFRCQTHPQESSPNRLNHRLLRTSLHLACTKKPPVSIVRVLVETAATTDDGDDQNDDSKTTRFESKRQQQQQRDKHGRTPLALAIVNNASLDVIDYLLELGRPTAMKLCKNGPGKNLSAIQIADRDGLLPLHLACCGYDCGQLELIQRLVWEYPPALYMTPQDARYFSSFMTKTKTKRSSFENSHWGIGQETVKRRATMTPLKYAFETGAPLNVVKLLIEEMMMAKQKEEEEEEEEEEDSFFEGTESFCPLIAALECSNGVSLEILQHLIQEYPQAVHQSRNKDGCLPFWIALDREQKFQYPLWVYKALAPSPSVILDMPQNPDKKKTEGENITENDSTILHQILAKRVGPASLVFIEIVQYMVQMVPEIANLWSLKIGYSPLALLEHQLSLGEDSNDPRFWKLLCMLLLAAHYPHDRVHRHAIVKKTNKTNNRLLLQRDDDNGGIFVLHAAVAMSSNPRTVAFALYRCSHQVYLRDCRGDYPLYLAIHKSPCERAKRNFILKILKMFPHAASTTASNDGIASLSPSSSSPSCCSCRQCLQQGRTGCCPHPTVLHMAARVAHTIHTNVWDKLISANPNALRIAAPSSGLFPFQIAAAVVPNALLQPPGKNGLLQKVLRRRFQFSHGDDPINKDLFQLNSIYKLLLAAPELVLA